RRRGASLAFLAPAHRQAERLQLAIKVRALKTRALGDARHAAVLAREKVFEVQALERLARLAVGPIERDLGQRARRRSGAEHSLDILEADFLLQRGKREVLHHALELGEISRPGMVAQRVQRSDGEAPGRAGA